MHSDEVLRDMQENYHKTTPPKRIPPRTRFLIGLTIALLIILMIVPYYAFKGNPEPNKKALSKLELPEISNPGGQLKGLEYAGQLNTTDTIRNLAIKIASTACKQTTNAEICIAKALFYYVQDKIIYLDDPAREFVQHPEQTLLGAGDCEDKAVLLYSLTRAVGIPSRIVTVPNHAFIQIYLRNAPTKYKTKDQWINLDPTCQGCKFGELDPKYVKYIEY